MVHPFVRVDVSRNARDFRHVLARAGAPMLDRSFAHGETLKRWLGRWTPEQNWDGETVVFYVRDEEGALLEVPDCRPATAAELRGPLRKELGAIREALKNVKPENPKETELHRAVFRQFEEDVSRSANEDPSSVFFRYRIKWGTSRLIWCSGYRRIDSDTGTAVVCPNPNCHLLALHRPGSAPKCRRCGYGFHQERSSPWPFTGS